jgi:hypothetical protein
MRRLCGGTKRSAAAVEEHGVPVAIRPGIRLKKPRHRLMMLVFPDPERPKRTVTARRRLEGDIEREGAEAGATVRPTASASPDP